MPQAIASVMTMPNGSSHWMGMRRARARPKSLFFWDVVHGPKVGDAFAVEMRLDIPVEPPVMLGRHVARNDKGNARTLCDLNRYMRSFDFLDAAKKDQWRAGARMGPIFVSRERHAVEHETPSPDFIHASASSSD